MNAARLGVCRNLLCFLSAVLGGAAVCAAEPANYIVDVWRFDDDLPRDGINSIVQGGDGYLWVSSRYGLARFDGVRFADFSSKSDAQFLGYHYANLTADKNGAVWIGLPGEGLLEWREGKLTRCLKPGNPVFGPVVGGLTSAQGRGLALAPDGRVVGWSNAVAEVIADASRWGPPVPWSVSQDRQGDIWFVTYQHSLLRVHGTNLQQMIYSSEEEPRNWIALQADDQGTIWAGTHREVGVWRGNDFQPIASPTEPFPVDDIIAVPRGSDGAGKASQPPRFWVIAVGVAWLLEGDRWLTNVPFQSRAGVYETSPRIADHLGNLWFTTTEATVARAGADGSLTVLSSRDGLPPGRVGSLCEDREGSIWLGVEHSGLARLRERYFETLGFRDTQQGARTWAVAEDSAGAIWLGTEHNGLHRWQEGKFTQYNLGPDNLPGSVYSLCIDRRQMLWAGTGDNGVFRFENGKFEPVWSYPEPSWNKRVYVIYEDRRSQMWFGTGAGLFCWSDGNVRQVTASFPMGTVRAIAEDRSGKLWFGLAAGAETRLASLEGEQLVGQGVADGLFGHDIFGLQPDGEGAMWIGTVGAGLWRWHDGTYSQMTSADGLPDDRIYSIEQDLEGNLWLGSPSGIVRVSKRGISEWTPGGGARLECLSFDRTDGLRTRECSGGSQPAVQSARDGRLLFALAEGAAAVSPERIRINGVPPPVIIEEVRVDGKPRSAGASPAATPEITGGTVLSLGPGRHVVEFHYTATSLIAPSKIRFKRQLKGVDRSWREPETARLASYDLSAPGDYTFRVSACNNDGIWNEAGTTLALTVAPYLWQTWPFKIGSALAILFVVVGAIRFIEHRRMQRKLEDLEKQQMVARERARIARDIHDDLGASLTEIALLSEFAQRDTAPADQIKADVRKIAAEALSSTRALDEIVWAVNPRNDTLEGFLSYACAYAEEQLGLAEIRCRLEAPASLPSRLLRADIRHHLFLAFKEAINNIVKHAGASEVAIRFLIDACALSIIIQDNGHGFALAPAAAPGVQAGNGLANMRERLESAGGRFACDSAPGSGTRVTLTMKLE